MKKINIFKYIILIISIITYIYLCKHQYTFNMTYLKCIIYVLLICLFNYICGIIVNDYNTYKKNIDIYIILYFILLFSLTFVIGRTNIKFYDWFYQGQCIPFKTISMQLKYGSIISILKNIFGNITILIPLSFLLLIKDDKYNNLFRQTLIILPTIIFIELFQTITHTGVFDIDDILLNYIGTIVFALILTKLNIVPKIKKIFYTNCLNIWK